MPTLLALGLSMVAVAATPRPAGASDRPTVVTLIVPLDAGAQAQVPRLEALTHLALYQSVRFTPQRMIDALDPDGAHVRAQREAEADQALAAGTRAYNDLDTATASREFEKAMRAFEATDLSRTFERFTQAWVFKIAAQVANGENRPAQKEIERLLSVNPRAEFPKAYFPPDMLAYSERVRRVVGSGGSGKLEVRSVPVPAEIYVDGLYRGSSPVTVRGLSPGDHFLTALATGFKIAQQRVREGTEEVFLPPASGESSFHAAIKTIAANPRTRERDTAAMQFGRALKADQVVVAIVQKSPAGEKLEGTVIRLDSADGHNYGFVTDTLALDSGFPAAWNRLVTGALVSDASRQAGEPVHHVEAGGGGAWTTQSTGFVLLGAGAALLAGAVYTGVEAKSRADQFRTTPQTSPQAQALASSGRTFALVADITGVAGVLAAAGGGALVLFGGNGGGEAAHEEVPMPPPPPARQPPREETKTREEPRRRADEDARRRADEDARRRADEDARRRADEDARRRTAADEARRKAEEDARRKTEAESKRRGDQESKRRAAEESKRQAEEESKRRADEQAKRRADEDAKRRADEDAKRRADEDAKRRAEEERRKREEQPKNEQPKTEPQKKKGEEEDLRNF